MKQKLHYEFSLDLLRVLAVVATFVIHTFDYYFYHFPTTSNLWWIGNILVTALKFLQPVFLTASAILLVRKGDENPGKIALDSIKKFIPIFVFWNIFFLLFAYWLGDKTILSRVNEIALGGTFYHMNMLSQIAAVYIFFPFISHLYRRLDAHSKLVLLVILLSTAIFEFVQHDLTLLGILGKMVAYKDFSVQGILGNMGICLLGLELFQRRKYLKVWHGFVLYIGSVLIGLQLSWLEITSIDLSGIAKFSYVPYAHYYSSLPVILNGLGIMWMIFAIRWKPSERVIEIFKFVSKRSLGYLMVHVIIRSLLDYTHILNGGSIIDLISRFGIMTLITIVLVELLYRTPVLKKTVGR